MPAALRPVVETAETVSKTRFVRLTPCRRSRIDRAQVTASTKEMAMKVSATARRPVSCEISFRKTVIRSRPRTTLCTSSSSAASVVVLIPPPVDAGDAPTSIIRQLSSLVESFSAS